MSAKSINVNVKVFTATRQNKGSVLDIVPEIY